MDENNPLNTTMNYESNQPLIVQPIQYMPNIFINDLICGPLIMMLKEFVFKYNIP